MNEYPEEDKDDPHQVPDSQLMYEYPEEDEDDPHQDGKDGQARHQVVSLPKHISLALCSYSNHFPPLALRLPRRGVRGKGSTAVWRIWNVLMGIRISILMLMRIRIRIILVRERKKIFPQNLHNYFFKNLTKLVMCNFLSSNAEGGVRDKG